MSWTALHAYAHGVREETDEFLLACVAPAIGRMLAEGTCAGWFFIRYWQGGPHVRVRLRDADPAAVDRLADELTAWLLDHPQPAVDPAAYYGSRSTSVSWQAHGRVVRAAYEPEVDRYGGPRAMVAAEDLFLVSTRVALAALASGGSRRLGVAYNLLTAFGHAVCDSSAAEATMLRRYVLTARLNTEDPSDMDIAVLRAQAETDFAAARPAYLSSAAKVRDALARDSRTGYLGLWHRSAASYAHQLRELAAAGTLAGAGSVWTILLSQLHMSHNRMGIDLAEEYHLAWLASLTAVQASMGEGYHDADLATPARRYHEVSKYFPVSLPSQLPRDCARPTRPAWGTRVMLPAPGAVNLSLGAALAGRRSQLSGYHGVVSLPDLATLLAHACGEHPGGEHPSAGLTPRRTYPSAGGMRPTRLLVQPARVPGLEPALYEYDPAAHELRHIAPAAELAETSPYLSTTQTVSLDPANVPLWLFVIGDIPAITARYGQRGYRFLLLEAGHLTQNVLLVATALGLRSAPIGAFHDDALAQALDLDGVGDVPLYLIPLGSGLIPLGSATASGAGSPADGAALSGASSPANGAALSGGHSPADGAAIPGAGSPAGDDW